MSLESASQRSRGRLPQGAGSTCRESQERRFVCSRNLDHLQQETAHHPVQRVRGMEEGNLHWGAFSHHFFHCHFLFQVVVFLTRVLPEFGGGWTFLSLQDARTPKDLMSSIPSHIHCGNQKTASVPFLTPPGVVPPSAHPPHTQPKRSHWVKSVSATAAGDGRKLPCSAIWFLRAKLATEMLPVFSPLTSFQA